LPTAATLPYLSSHIFAVSQLGFVVGTVGDLSDMEIVEKRGLVADGCCKWELLREY